MPAQQKRFRIEAFSAPEPSRLAEPAPLAAPAPLPSDLVRIQVELAGMKDAIASTKREIARMKRSGAGHDGVGRAVCELDAVFDATERATTTILGAVEEIEEAANMLRAAGSDAGRNDFLGTILDRVVLLYETCNFQDVSGQRIEKVVDTLKFIDTRLDLLLSTWSGLDAPEAAKLSAPIELSLISGPPLAGDSQISQSDIDNYF